jgi:hypothetical protein
MYKNIYYFCLLPIILFAFLGCKNIASRPKSVGKPYEVLVVGDVNNIVYNALSVPTPGLLQAEPMVDVIEAKKLSVSNNNFRTIVVVQIKKTTKKGIPSICLIEKDNEFVDNQLVIYIKAEDEAVLKRIMPEVLIKILQKEIMREQQNLIQKPNNKAEALVLKLFRKQISLPTELTESKVGKDFLWLSNNASEGMMNICLYYINEKKFQAQHDSVMQQNIQGTQKGDYLALANISSKTISKHTGNITIRGTWQMKKDAMGGSFVTYLLPKVRKQDKCLAVEAFLFAPEKEKRNRMRRLEAALYTLH